MYLQIKQSIGQLGARRFLDVLPNQGCQFVSVLARRWYSNRSRPIIVQMAQFVAQPLHLVWLKLACIVKNDVMRRVDGTLPDVLGY